MKFFQQHYQRMNYIPLDDKFVERVNRRRDEMVRKFRKGYEKDYGWASGFVRNPTYAEIEKNADLDYWKPHYLWASASIHGGIKGMTMDVAHLGSQREDSAVLGGPSSAGLADTVQFTAISLHNCTYCFAAQRPTPARASSILAMVQLVERIGEASYRVEGKLKAAEAKPKPPSK
jgi:hypothetical protein